MQQMIKCLRMLAMAVTMMGVWGASAWAANEAVVGQEYQVLSRPQATSNPGKIVVTEFFSYQCPHCFSLSPSIKAWAQKLPADVVFERVPVGFGRSNWNAIGQAFYALQSMGKADQLDSVIFNGIHTQGLMLKDQAAITQFLAKNGVDAEEFANAYNSFGVKASMSRANQLVRPDYYNVEGVPDIVVDGKYRVINAGSQEQWLARVDKVIAKVRAERNRK